MKFGKVAHPKNIHFFIHQNLEKESPLLVTHFIKNLNSELGLNLRILNDDSNLNGQTSLL